MNHILDLVSIKKQKYFESILESFNDGIYITDSEANTIYLNHKYELISGLKKTEMLGKNMKQLVSDGVISVSGTLSVLENGQKVTIEQNFKTGKRALITSLPIYDDEQSDKKDNILIILTIVHEITEIYSLRNEITRLNNLNKLHINEIDKLYNKLNGNIEIIAVDEIFKKTKHLAEKIALTDNPIIISGENGTGKEKLARHIHKHSNRSDLQFISINIKSIETVNQDDFFFGFLDKNNIYHNGIIDIAYGGTLYINELLELSTSTINKFFNLIKHKTYILNDGTIKKYDIRVIIGSSFSINDLKTNIKLDQHFLDLFLTFPLSIPPLKQRKDDIIPLAQYFLSIQNQATKQQKFFSEDFLIELLKYPWPYNISELKKVILQSSIISSENNLSKNLLNLTINEINNTENSNSIINNKQENIDNLDFFDLKVEVAKYEAKYLEQAFVRFGNTRDAAEFLKMDSSTFVRKRQRYIKKGYMKS